MNSKPLDRELLSWLDDQLEDSFDEEYEMEIDDLRSLKEVEALTDLKPQSALDRRTYLRELLRLQAELVKLQDWVVHAGYKLVVIFEGRDTTGKGGSIKQFTQRLYPRVCRTAALPAPTDREKTQWYFQRYVPHLPAAGEIARGATGPASHGLCVLRPPWRSNSSLAMCPNSSACSRCPTSN